MHVEASARRLALLLFAPRIASCAPIGPLLSRSLGGETVKTAPPRLRVARATRSSCYSAEAEDPRRAVAPVLQASGGVVRPESGVRSVAMQRCEASPVQR